jgi:glutamate dehydrogenase
MLVRSILGIHLYSDLSLHADCGWVFAQHFCNRLGPAYLHLRNVLDETNPAHAEVLNDIKMRFREETFTRESIQQVIHAHPELVGSVFKYPT